ncbi:unnamed protein product, partial [Effrenium voratum]
YLCGSLLGNLSHTHGNFCTANSYSSKVTVAARAMKDLLASPGAGRRHEEWTESPVPPGWQPKIWQPGRAPAWQASFEESAGRGELWCKTHRSPVASVDSEEEIDRFLCGLQMEAASFEALSGSHRVLGQSASDTGSEPWTTSRWPFGAPSPEVPEAEPLLPCSKCGRSFWARRLEVHEPVCKAVPRQAKRGVFESRRQRLRDLPVAQAIPAVNGAPDKAAVTPKQQKGKTDDVVTPVKLKAGKATKVSPSPEVGGRLRGRKVLDTPPKSHRSQKPERVDESFQHTPSPRPVKLAEARWQPEPPELSLLASERGGPISNESQETLEARSGNASLEMANSIAFEAACADSPSDRDVEELDSLSPLRIGPILDDEAAQSDFVALDDNIRDDQALEEMSAEKLFNRWIRCETGEPDEYSGRNEESVTEPLPARLALVSEAAALCAEVDALLGQGGPDTGPEVAGAEAGEATKASLSAMTNFELNAGKPQVPEFPCWKPYDPSKYCEAQPDVKEASDLQGWLRRCAEQIELRRQELESWQTQSSLFT